MPVLISKISEPTGPLIPVLVGLPADEATQPQGQREQPSLIDTGASSSFIDAALAKGMGVKPVESTDVLTPSSGPDGKPAVVYEVSLCFRHPQMETLLRRVRVVESELAVQGFGLILGRDVLAHFLVIYSGHEKTCTLAL